MVFLNYFKLKVAFMGISTKISAEAGVDFLHKTKNKMNYYFTVFLPAGYIVIIYFHGTIFGLCNPSFGSGR